jgi:hypothetical protein
MILETYTIYKKNNIREICQYYRLYEPINFEVIGIIRVDSIIYRISGINKPDLFILNRNIKNNSGMLITIKNKYNVI